MSTYTTVRTFPSKTSDAIHTVKMDEDGALSCSCPRWRFKRGDTRTCKHVEEVAASGQVSSGPVAQQVAPALPEALPPSNGGIPSVIMPMLAGVAPAPFDSPAHLFEVKWDGIRCLAFVDGGVRLQSRSGRDITGEFPEIASTLRGQLAVDGVVLDGEMVALDAEGKPRMGNLGVHQRRLKGATIAYQVFDLLYVKGESVMGLPLLQRKELLLDVLGRGGPSQYCDHVVGDGVFMFNSIEQMGLEGVMAKRLTSLYRPGQRSDEWQKIKPWRTGEFIIAGYTRGKGARAATLGAVILARREGDRLVHAGSAGTGFNLDKEEAVLAALEPLRVDRCPLLPEPKLRDEPRWCQPVLACAVKYQEVTDDGVLRFPVFVGLKGE